MQKQQNCSHKTGHIGTKTVSNGSSKISFVSLLRKNSFYLFILFWYFEFQARHEELCREK